MQNAKAYYDENGYYIFRKLIPEPLIDQLLTQYQQTILPSADYFFRQSTNRWQKNKLTAHGYSEESFIDIHDYPKYPTFGQTAMQIFCADFTRQALTELTGNPEHNLMQSMLFDKNTGTPAHQDWYYLDSIPNGHMLAGWFALEDIQEAAGRFYVLPQSNHVDFDLTEDERISNSPYMVRLKSYVAEHQDCIYVPALQKGDVLFWNSRTIHGSTDTQNPALSRKSLTAHYIPSQYQYGTHYSDAPMAVDYEVYEGMKYRLIPADRKYYSLKHKIRTDLRNYLWYHPKLKRMVTSIAKPLVNVIPSKSLK
jgi:phytanoyl-CoA hydroxylase